MFQKSEESLSDVPPTKDKMDLDNFPLEVKGRIRDFSKLVILVKEPLIFVVNPLTGEKEELPPLLHRRNPVLTHVYVDHSSKSYCVLAAGSSASGEESLSRITELYDSRTGQWERVGDLPGPAFAVNEHQSGVFRNGNIFCIEFVVLGDQPMKGILVYNVEEGIWSTKWTDNSILKQLLKNCGDLFLRDNDRVFERIEWSQSEGDEEEKTEIFTLVKALKKIKSGGRSLEVCPEYESHPLRGVPWVLGKGFTQARMSSAPSSKRFQRSNPGRSFEFSALLAVALLNLLSVVGATSASVSWPSSSTPEVSSSYPTFASVGVGATIVGTGIGLIAVGVKLYRYFTRRESGDSLQGAIEALTRPFQGYTRGLRIRAGKLKVGESTLDELVLKTFPGSSAASSAASSTDRAISRNISLDNNQVVSRDIDQVI